MQAGDAREKELSLMYVCISRCKVLSDIYATWSIGQSILPLRTGITGIILNVGKLLNREYPINESICLKLGLTLSVGTNV